MKRLPFTAVVAIAVGASFAPNVSADAPPDQYAPFNYQDRRITDQHTKLVWERAISTTPLTTTIDAYCLAPTRLPTVKELLTLVDETPSLTYDDVAQQNVKVHIDQNAFSYRQGYVRTDKPFCTQTLDSSAANRYVVDFGTGLAQMQGSTAPCYARCVHFVP